MNFKNMIVYSLLILSISRTGLISQASDLNIPVKFTNRDVSSPIKWITGFKDIPVARSSVNSESHEGKIYFIGGYANKTVNNMDIYDTNINSWSKGKDIPVNNAYFASTFYNGKIYLFGGWNESGFLSSTYVYDINQNIWSEKSPMSKKKLAHQADVYNNEIYVIGGRLGETMTYLKEMEIYNPNTNTWRSGISMPTERESLLVKVYKDKLYCIGGKNSSNAQLSKIEVFDLKTNQWSTKVNSTYPIHGGSIEAYNDKLYCFSLGRVQVYDINTNSWSVDYTFTEDRGNFTTEMHDGLVFAMGGKNSFANSVDAYVLDNKFANVIQTVLDCENTQLIDKIAVARNLVNNLDEGVRKTVLQNRINTVSPDILMDLKNVTSNLDVYIKSQNMLSLSLDTNSVSFDNFSGVEDMEYLNGINLEVSSSLPYKLKAYLPIEIQNTTKTETIDKSILNIKVNGESTYKTFNDLVTPVILLDNQFNGSNIVHNIDLMLKGNIAHKADIYKTTIKFEVEQK